MMSHTMSEDPIEKSRNLAKRTHEMLVGMSETDSLTGLLNKRGWDKRTENYLDLAERTGQSVSFMSLDLDDLKKINDETRSHEAGNKLLRDAAEIIKKVVRSTDILGRVGGDEFAVCLPNTQLWEAANLQDRLIKELGIIRVSVGIGKSFADADIEMYKMKKEHKNG